MSSERAKRFLGAARLFGFFVLSWILGALTAEFGMFPYGEVVRPGLRAFEGAVTSTASEIDDGASSIDDAYPGSTVYSTSGVARAFRIGLDGEVLQTWEKPLEEVWRNPGHVDSEQHVGGAYWRRIQPVGADELLAVYAERGSARTGLGLVKLDAASEVVWSFAERAHDFALGADGTVFVLLQDAGDGSTGGHVAILSPDGRERERISIRDAIERSPFRRLLRPERLAEANGSGEPWATDVDVLSPEFARHHDWAEPGQLLVSFPAEEAIAVIDISSGTLVWATRGFWKEQSDPDPLPNGNIIGFDRLGDSGTWANRSRVIEFNPDTGAIPWVFPPDDELPFDEPRGSQQVLPNGHVLLTLPTEGVILEVNRAGDPIWTHRSPGLEVYDALRE